MSELIIQSGKLQGKRLVLPSKVMIIGRDDECDMKIASSLVSRKHCSLKATPEGILVTDLGSQNGTHVNEVAINEPTLIKAGDQLRIGAIIFAVPSLPKTRSSAVTTPSPAKVSEADIADWLTESGSNFAGSADTQEIETYNQAAATPPAPQPIASPKPQHNAIPKVMTIKDEAAAIIRKHWEAVKARKQP